MQLAGLVLDRQRGKWEIPSKSFVGMKQQSDKFRSFFKTMGLGSSKLSTLGKMKKLKADRGLFQKRRRKSLTAKCNAKSLTRSWISKKNHKCQKGHFEDSQEIFECRLYIRWHYSIDLNDIGLCKNMSFSSWEGYAEIFRGEVS